MLRIIDDILNDYPMYRVVVYGLIALLLIAIPLSLTGAISVSAGGIALSMLILGLSCWLSNELFSRLLKIPSNSESYLITAMILTCILPPVSSWQRAAYLALTALIAMASKYLITYRSTHIFNPAAFGAFVMSIAGLLPAVWWVATPWLTPFTILLGLAVLRKTRRFQLFGVFALAAVGMLLLLAVGYQHQSAVPVIHSAIVSWPIIFFGSIMLTEPSTLPPTNLYKILLAIIVGLLFTSQLQAGRLASTPQAVLVFGNLLTFLAAPAFGAMLKLKQINQLSPTAFELIFSKPAYMRYQAGQYFELTLPHPKADLRGYRRTFSVASSPSEPDVRIGIRRYDPGSSFKTALLKLQPDTSVRLAHIEGTFTLPADLAQPLLFIAGGIGITPFRSMINSLTAQRDIILLYLATSADEFIWRDNLNQAAKNGVRVHYLTERLTATELQQLVPDYKQRLVYISGPNAMVRGYKQLLKAQGVAGAQIKSDHFTGY